MFENFATALTSLPPTVATFLLAMTPYGELRLSIPIAYLVYDLPLWQSYIISVIGNMVPPLIIMLLAEPFNEFIKNRSGFFGAKWAITLNRVRTKFTHKYEKLGLVGLLLFVAVPLPTTGAWTAALIAFLFGFPFKKSLLMIFSGVLIAGLLISLIVALPTAI